MKTKAELPNTFEELGMSEMVSMIYEAAGQTPAKVLDILREDSFFLYRREGSVLLTEIPTDELETSMLKANFVEAAAPYLEDYILPNASVLYEGILSTYWSKLHEEDDDLREIILAIKKYCVDHYDELSNIDVNEDFIKTIKKISADAP